MKGKLIPAPAFALDSKAEFRFLVISVGILVPTCLNISIYIFSTFDSERHWTVMDSVSYKFFLRRIVFPCFDAP